MAFNCADAQQGGSRPGGGRRIGGSSMQELAAAQLGQPFAGVAQTPEKRSAFSLALPVPRPTRLLLCGPGGRSSNIILCAQRQGRIYWVVGSGSQKWTDASVCHLVCHFHVHPAPPSAAQTFVAASLLTKFIDARIESERRAVRRYLQKEGEQVRQYLAYHTNRANGSLQSPLFSFSPSSTSAARGD